jgi:hypothetical protein
VYVSRLKNVLDPTIDTRCTNCGKRKQFKPNRVRSHYYRNAGRIRNVEFYKRPEHMPRKALLEEAKARNNLHGFLLSGFILASEMEGDLNV